MIPTSDSQTNNSDTNSSRTTLHDVVAKVDWSNPQQCGFACLYVVQSSGNLTARALHSILKSAGCPLDERQVEDTCEDLRSRGLFSFCSGRIASGETARAYKVRNLNLMPM
jgi:hypothetical protein